jgi:flagellar hook assembly protein FlgD
MTRLLPNAPNPFNPSTRIHFQVARPGRVDLAIYDVNGRLVRTLADGHLEAGPHALIWDGHDDADRLASSGIYFVRLHAGSRTDSRRVVLLK